MLLVRMSKESSMLISQNTKHSRININPAIQQVYSKQWSQNMRRGLSNHVYCYTTDKNPSIESVYISINRCMRKKNMVQI